jgi:hypothetical protein
MTIELFEPSCPITVGSHIHYALDRSDPDILDEFNGAASSRLWDQLIDSFLRQRAGKIANQIFLNTSSVS